MTPEPHPDPEPEPRTFPDHETGDVYHRIPAAEFPVCDEVDSTEVPTSPEDPV